MEMPKKDHFEEEDDINKVFDAINEAFDDINEAFDDITFAEQRTNDISLAEGYEFGRQQGEREGYRSGYEIGYEIGHELATIYGTTVAVEQSKWPADTPTVKKLVQKLRAAIESFPQQNDYQVDIQAKLEEIRFKYKHLCTILHLNASLLNVFAGNRPDDKPPQPLDEKLSF